MSMSINRSTSEYEYEFEYKYEAPFHWLGAIPQYQACHTHQPHSKHRNNDQFNMIKQSGSFYNMGDGEENDHIVGELS